jgi:hypothetical protein
MWTSLIYVDLQFLCGAFFPTLSQVTWGADGGEVFLLRVSRQSYETGEKTNVFEATGDGSAADGGHG